MTFRTHEQGLAASVAHLTALAETLDVRDHAHIHAVLGELHRRTVNALTDVQVTTWDSGVLVALGPGVDVAGWALDVFVPGEPKTQGSFRPIKHKVTGKAVMIPSNNTGQRDWRAYMRDVVGQAWAGRQPSTDPVVMCLDFVLPRRKSAPKGWTPHHTRKPDPDKLVRAVRDALTSVVYADDAQVVTGTETKREAEPGEAPGVRIRVALLPERTKQ